MKTFTSEPLIDIFTSVETALKDSQSVTFEILNPDCKPGFYAGEVLIIDGIAYIYRSYKALHHFAELMFCRMLTPKIASEHTILVTFVKLDASDSFHHSEEKEEKYGTSSHFARIHKNEEPTFLNPYLRALRSVKIKEKKRILNLGINTGDEFNLIRHLLSTSEYHSLELVGIDHSPSAIQTARKRFNEGNALFYVHDINDLDSLDLGQFDLIITIGTLQSTSVEFKPLFASLVQKYLTPDGAMILGFPNCRWMDGEMIYGAKAPNYPYSEMSILIKDLYYCKKYLQQKKFRVTVTGSDYLFLTATKIGL
jgi:2-polyprenyl-3-methyl-5-hydroxy-6-metoxy-1,4-benzoquinol methylase